jgi:3'(2'),5'-bisphosphate nucleotidase
MIDRTLLLEALAEAAHRAGEAILAIYATDFAVTDKQDNSPVTEADQRAEAIILEALARVAPDIPVVAEEEVAAGRCPDVDHSFFLVDPLDGTREFVERRGDFTVNIALVEHHAPTLGIVLAPVEARLFAGDVTTGVAWQEVDGTRSPIRVRPAPDRLVAVASRSHGSASTEAYLEKLPIAERVSRGSSLKLCLVACGEADIYPRLGPTYEWDIAAGDAVLRAAGGSLLDPEGAPMRYGKPRFWNRGFLGLGGGVIAPAIGPFLE